jgi:hypothetical protein
MNQISATDATAWYRHCGYQFPPDDPVQPL